MRTTYTVFYLLAMSLLGFGCTEIGPEINPIGGQLIERDSNELVRKVLIEEFTGVRCVNCPAGTAEVLRLQALYNGRLIAVSIHAGSFSRPYTESTIDFRNPESDALLNYLGTPLGYPSAVVNRKVFSGERDLQLGKNQWPAFIDEELSAPPRIAIDLKVNFDQTSREMDLSVELDPLENLLNEDLNISVMLIEDEIVNVQLTPDGKKNDYFHRHSLRDMLTAPNGNSIQENLIMGETIAKEYKYILPADWRANQCSVVVLVHKNSDDISVLQVEEVKILN